MIYGIRDMPKTAREFVLYAFQQVLAVFVATVLIATICGTPISSCLFGACVGTILYQLITGFRSPMFISSCGATCSAVIGALAIGETGQNYLAVAIGGLIVFLIYAIFAIVTKAWGIKAINRIFPPAIVGAVTIVIGLNLATFIPAYVAVDGEHNDIGVAIAVATMVVVALTSHYFKGFLKTIPFLIGLLFGYAVSAVLTLTGVCQLIDFSMFNNMRIISVPDFTFLKWDFAGLSWGVVGQVCLFFIPVAICAMLEHYSDHKVLSNIINVDLTEKPGLHRTLLGDGAASWLGTMVCGLPNTSYGESIATTGFSRVASVYVITFAAGILGLMSFVTPIQIFLQTIPACVFGGCAMILYGYIASSGLRTIINSKIDIGDNRNLIIISVILTVGVSGIFWFHESFTGVALAMILGVILNLILKKKEVK